MFSLNFMFFCSLIEELCTKEENYKTSCNFNFGHVCSTTRIEMNIHYSAMQKHFPYKKCINSFNISHLHIIT